MKTMSLTLTVSRFALAIQYAVTMIYARKNTKPIAPFAIHFAVMFVAGFLYLGVRYSHPYACLPIYSET